MDYTGCTIYGTYKLFAPSRLAHAEGGGRVLHAAAAVLHTASAFGRRFFEPFISLSCSPFGLVNDLTITTWSKRLQFLLRLGFRGYGVRCHVLCPAELVRIFRLLEPEGVDRELVGLFTFYLRRKARRRGKAQARRKRDRREAPEQSTLSTPSPASISCERVGVAKYSRQVVERGPLAGCSSATSVRIGLSQKP